MTDPWNRPRERLLCAEPLEGRWLLSALAPPSLSSTQHDGGADEDAGEPGSGLSATPLPEWVRATIAGQFPAARLLGAEFGVDDGQPVYEVNADVGGSLIELSIAADGGLIQLEPVRTANRSAETSTRPARVSIPAPQPAARADAPATEAANEVLAADAVIGGVEVVEFEPAEEDEADGDVDVAPADLPKAVSEAFDARFPGATIIEAESGVDDGEPEFDITARFNGQVIDVTFTPDGEVIETEQALTTAELPQAVRDWLGQHFAGAAVNEASAAIEDGELTFEILIAPPDGGPEVEATLRVPGASPPPAIVADPGAPAGPRPDLVGPPAAGNADHAAEAGATGAWTDAANDAQADAAEGVAPVPQGGTQAARPAVQSGSDRAVVPTAGHDGARANSAAERGADATLAPDASADLVAAALGALAASAPPVAWLPEVAGVLHDVLPVDVAAAERELRKMLHELDLLAESVVGERGAADVVSRFALAAALIGLAQMLRFHSKRPGGGPAVVFNGANPSWSWVLGRPSESTKRT